MNQLMKKIIIFIIVILMIVGILAVTSIAYTYNNTDSNVIIGTNNTEYTLSTGQIVYASQDGYNSIDSQRPC